MSSIDPPPLWRKRGFFSRLIRKKGDYNRHEGMAAPPAVPAKLSGSATESSATDLQIHSIKELQSHPGAQVLNPPASLVQEPAAAPFSEHYPARKAARKETAIQPEQIWDQAYDDLKHDQPELLELYETIISYDLDSSEGAKGNVIEQDREKRQSQMDQLLDVGMAKTAKLAKVEGNIGDAIKVVLSVKGSISSGLQAVPIAAIVWTGVCVMLELFQNPIKEATENRKGIAQVISNMKWYSGLSQLLLEEMSQNEEHLAKLRRLLADRILHLYKRLLNYVIKSICAYNRNPVHGYLRNLVKLDDWSGTLDDVTEAENLVKEAASKFGVLQANSYLGLLANMHISKAQNDIMQELFVSDMTAEIKSLQQRKDALLADSYKWILSNKQYRDFTSWQKDNTRRLLWIKGDAGKGKTMLLIGIVTSLTAELETHFDKPHLSYFFCQATNGSLNTATAILRGLIWMLARQQRSLIRHMDKFKDGGSKHLEGGGAFYRLKDILLSMLEDEALDRVYLAIDALDECKTDEPGLVQLLELISEVADKNNKVKWLVTSRNEVHIGKILDKIKKGARLSLELNADSVASAVNMYIDHKKLALAAQFDSIYGDSDDSILAQVRQVQEDIVDKIRRKADGTFLWVALVFRQIHDNMDAKEVLELVCGIPAELDGMYDQMMNKFIQQKPRSSKKVLLVMVNTYRPLQLSELASLAALPDLSPPSSIVRLCGLLAIDEDGKTVYFVHQSAKDYLIGHADEIFPSECAGHHSIVSQSLKAMGAKLKRNIYKLQYPGHPITDVPVPHPDSLVSIRYACLYWIDHLCEVQRYDDVVELCGTIDVFLKEHFLHWLEALSLMSKMSEGVLALNKFARFLTGISLNSELLPFVQDAHRFILFNRGVIENFPQQAYSSALLFSPARSLTRERFKGSEPDWIITKPRMEAGWGACLQTLEGHGGKVSSVAFSHDGTRVVSGSFDRTVKIWDTSSGACLQTLEGHNDSITSVAFSHDGIRMASGSYDKTIKIWDTSSGTCLQTLEGHSESVVSIAFSHDSIRVVSGSVDRTVKIWDTGSGAYLQTLESHNSHVISIAFSYDSIRIVSGSVDRTVKIWDTSSGACLQTLEGHNDSITSVAFSHDGIQVVSGSYDNTIKIWDTSSGTCLQTLEGHSESVVSIAFSHDSIRVASGSHDETIKVWDTGSGACLQTLEGHNRYVTSVAFSHDSTRVASGSYDETVKIWDTSNTAYFQTLEGHNSYITSIAFSYDSIRVVSGSVDRTVKIWDTSSGACLQTLEGHSEGVVSIAFSHDGKRVASGSNDKTIKVWDIGSGACLQTLEGHSRYVTSVAFSHDGKQVVSGSCDKTVKIWDTSNGTCLQTLEGHNSSVVSVAFSHDGTRVALKSYDTTVKIWDVISGTCLQTLERRYTHNLPFVSSGSHLFTDTGTTSLHTQPASNTIQTTALKQPRLHRYGLSTDRAWITWDDRNVLWLPVEYRPQNDQLAIAPSTIVIGCSSGRVMIYKFSSEISPLL